GFGGVEEATTKEMPSLPPPSGRASDGLGDTDDFGNDRDFGESDVFASLAPSGAKALEPAAGAPPALPVAAQQQAPAAKRSMLPITGLVLRAAGPGGGSFYYQNYRPPASGAPQPKEGGARASGEAPGEPAEPAAAPSAPAQAAAPAAPAQAAAPSAAP